MSSGAAGFAALAPLDVYFITGASRGLGLEMVKQLLSTVPQALVVAACRAPEGAKDLQALAAQHPGRAHVIQLDTSDEKSVKAAASWVDNTLGGRVDVLVSNAGMMEKELKPWHAVDVDEATALLRTNVIGPLLVAGALLPALRKGHRKMIVNISSSLGSISSVAADAHAVIHAAHPGGSRAMRLGPQGTPAPVSPSSQRFPTAMATAFPFYKASKAALNMEMLLMARDLAPDGFTVVSLHPGWVATDMGTASAAQMNKLTTPSVGTGQPQGVQPPLTADRSVAGMLSVMRALGPADSGRFISYNGSDLPW